MFSSPQNENQVPQKDVETLNSLLPLHLSLSDAEKNPQFVNLIQQLTRLITPDGVSRDVHKDLHQAEEILRHEKHTWLQSHILHHEIQEMILDYDLRAHDTGLSTADKEFKEILEQCLNFAEGKDYLSFSPDPSSKVTLLGIQPEDLQSRNPYKKHLPSLQQKLIPELEDRLRQRCETLVDMFQSSSATTAESLSSNDLALAKASQLPAMVEHSIQTLEEEQKQVKGTREKREKQFWLYFQTLLDSLGLLEKMVNVYRLGKQSQNNSITAEWLVARCDAMCLKIKYVALQILCDTYTAETVGALKIIKGHLTETIEMTEKDLHRVNLAIQAYGAVGSGFDDLVEEYGKLKNELDNKQWALNEFQHTS